MSANDVISKISLDGGTTEYDIKDPNAQPKNLTAPITINGEQKTTVESALNGLNSKNSYDGSNLLISTSKTGSGTTVTLTIPADTSLDDAIGTILNTIAAVNTSVGGKLDSSLKGSVNGVAELDANGLVPSAQLPSYVDDVLEYSAKSSFPATGETGKIYVDNSTNLTYRWSGSAYVEISPSLALGETSGTAYRGDRGKAAYDHSQLTSGNPHNVTKSDVGLGNVGNFKAVSTVTSQGLTDTEKSNARSNIGAGTSSLALGTTASTAAKGDHTHTTSLATDSGTATVTLARNTTYKLTAGGTNVIFKTPASDNTNNRRGFWGTSSTAAATAEKAVTLGSTTGWELVAGTIVGVKFTNTNTAGTVKLNVNSSGAKQIWYNGAAYTGTEARITGWAGHTIYYIYDGTYWEFINNDANYINTNTTYESKAAASGGTAVSLCTTGEKYTWNNKLGTLYNVTDSNNALLLTADEL